jgi:putative spermidine/putrescine transport system permease protein
MSTTPRVAGVDVGRPAALARPRTAMRETLLERLTIPLMLAPMLLLILVLFVGSMVFAFSQSLGYMPIIDKYDLTLIHYANVFTSGEFLASAGMSLHIAFTSTLLSTILAIVSALALRELFWGKRFITFLFQLSIPIPHMIAALAILLLTTQSGLVARLAYHAGLITEPAQFPALVFDHFGIGIILVYLVKETPFIGLIVLAILQGLGREYEESAATLGAHRWQRFRYVLLPLMAPGLLSAFIVVFAYVFGAFEIPALLGRTYPTALPVLAYKSYMDFDLNARPESMAMSIVILAFTLVITGVYMKISQTYIRR